MLVFLIFFLCVAATQARLLLSMLIQLAHELGAERARCYKSYVAFSWKMMLMGRRSMKEK